jgi:tRNA (mo5U34)-methyltransferase
MSDGSPGDAASPDRIPFWHTFELPDGRKVVGEKSVAVADEWKLWGLPEDLSGKTFLDVGCFDGGFSVEAVRRGAARVVAIDGARTAGMRWLQAQGELFEFRELNVYDPAFAELGEFDVVLCAGVYYHVSDPMQLFCTLRGLTRESLFVEGAIDPANKSPKPLFEFFPGAELNDDPTNWWRPNAAGLRAILEACGLDVVSEGITSDRMYAHCRPVALPGPHNHACRRRMVTEERWHAESDEASEGSEAKAEPPGRSTSAKSTSTGGRTRAAGSPWDDVDILLPCIDEADARSIREQIGPARDRLRVLVDTERVGPDAAYMRLWGQSRNDVILWHTDMAPADPEHWLDELLGYVRAHPQVGIFGCKLLYPTREGAHWLVQSAGGLLLASGEPEHIGGGYDVFTGTQARAAKNRVLDDGRCDVPRRVDWVTFGGCYIRRAVIDAVGDMDAGYRFSYYSDVDYCLRARQKGFGVAYVPVAIFHDEGRDNKKRPDIEAIRAENRERFLARWRSDGATAFARRWRNRLWPHGRRLRAAG